jgi:hypothetical protein
LAAESGALKEIRLFLYNRIVLKAFQVHTHAWCNPNNRETWGESNEKKSLLDAVWYG